MPASWASVLQHLHMAPLGDAGNRPSNHYREKLSPRRFALRQRLLPVVRRETELLARLQAKFRHPALDLYFAWTANLALHTFYVLMLPLPLWYGGLTVVRDLVVVLGLGIYITGFLKDYLCLPRPRLPPLQRVTMSSYTTQEYGWPSLHAANATAVTLVLAFAAKDAAVGAWVYVALFAYWFSLIVGRLYCGMHGFMDIGTGAVIGVVLFLFRRFFGEAYDNALFNYWPHLPAGMLATGLAIVFGHLFLIHIFPEPVDDCPCFEDLVLFIGVLIGLDLAHYACVVTRVFARDDPLLHAFQIPYSVMEATLVQNFGRFLLGAGLVVAWKTASKPVIFTILPPVYKFVGIYLPRLHYLATAHLETLSRQIRRQSLSNMVEPPLPLRLRKKVEVGPVDDIDAYELLDYNSSHPEAPPVKVTVSGVFRPRYDVEIIGRTIVYAGISITAVWGFYYGSLIFF